MILELMRPEVPADYDHLMRLHRYVTRVRVAVDRSDTRERYKFKAVRGLLIADSFAEDPALKDTLNQLATSIDAVTWNGLFLNVSS
jgi:hypothetical protein